MSSDHARHAGPDELGATLWRAWLRQYGFPATLLLLAVILVYQPVWHAGYLWDDDTLLTANPCIVGPLGLGEIWTTPHADICPLTLTTLWLLHKLWGLAPLPYHLLNVALHGVGALLLWQVLRRCRVPGAWLGAALWALHPVQVESVAWVSEIKNTQSGVFYLLAILFFLRWRSEGKGDRRSWRAYALTLLCTALALASKSSTMILPLIFGLLVWWLEKRLRPRDLFALAPMFGLSLASGLASLWTQFQPLPDDVVITAPQTMPARLIVMGKVAWFYLGKLAWPHALTTIYPRWHIDPSQWLQYLPLAALLVVLLVCWSQRRRAWMREGLFVWAYFLAGLLPVSGAVTLRFFRLSFVADHFVYLASMGPCAFVGAGIVCLTSRLQPLRLRLVSPALALVPLLLLGTLSRQQALIYENQVTLWTDALSKNPNCWQSHKNLGTGFAGQGKINEALGQYREALRLKPDNASVRNNLGDIFAATGQIADAIAQYRAALNVLSKEAESRHHLGDAYLHQGHVHEAEFQYKLASADDPLCASVHNNLGDGLLHEGRVEECIIQCRLALDIAPTSSKAHLVLGRALWAKGQPEEAISQFQQSVKSAPSDASARNDLGVALANRGEWQEAVAQLREAVRLKPEDVATQKNLAGVEATVRQASGQP